MRTPSELFKDGDALLVIDVQNDFCPGGELPVEGGDAVVPVLNRYIDAALEKNIPVFFSRDFHPIGHISFRKTGGDWPPHCIQDTKGAQFHPELKVPERSILVTKGVRFDKDQNSAFDQTGLAYKLREDGIKRMIAGGLAQDVCVRASVLDGLREGFEVVLLLSATRPVSLEEGKKAFEEMKEAGAEII